MARPGKSQDTTKENLNEEEKVEQTSVETESSEKESSETESSEKVLIQNKNLANQKTKILGGDTIEFDSMGVANVEKEIAEKLLKFKSFKLKK